MTDMQTVTVDVGDRTYPVIIGSGARHQLPSLVPGGVRRIAIVTQEGVPQALVPDFPGLDVTVHRIGNGEQHKSLGTVEQLCRGFARDGLNRSDLVVGVGGGMVTDVAGFAAASYHRGISVMHVSTTLLGMIDAAVGGKTGVNIPEGKNLVGAFWQPSAVMCDTDALDSLPDREMRCGLGEMAKYHFIAQEDLSALPLVERIARCVEIKARIVESDERESGRRALLNYGHTLAHAIETLTDYSIAHGEAVSLGILFAANLAEVTGRIDADRVDEHYAVVHGTYGLALPVPPGLDISSVIAEMGRDKKALGSLTFVLDSTRGLEVVPGVPPEAVESAWQAFTARNG